MDATSHRLIRKIYKSQYNLKYKFPGPFGDRYITYADYIASGQPVKFIEKFIKKVVLPSYANTHTEASFTGLQTSNFREEAREIIKASVNASKEDVLLFSGSGSTGAIDLLNRKLIQFYSSQKVLPIVIIGPYEHHSNILPWREGPFDLVELTMCNEGNVNLQQLEWVLKKHHSKRPIIGSFSAASNVTGIIAPVKKIHHLLKKYDALSFWDYAGAAPYVSIDMNPEKEEGLDAVFISPHKLVGGTGSPGVLVAKRYLFSENLPVVAAGGTVHYVTKSQQKYTEDIEAREEGGTPSIVEAIRAGMAFKLKDKVGSSTIESIEHQFIVSALEKIKKHSNIYVLGNLNAPRLGFLAFHIQYKDKFLHHNFVVALLNDLFGIQARGGCSCAGPYGHDLLEVDEEKSEKYIRELQLGNAGIKPGWVRLNFNYFIPKKEFNYLIDCIIWISKNGWKLLNSYHFADQKGLWTLKNKVNLPSIKLEDFNSNYQKPLIGTYRDRKKMRVQYLKVADQIAVKALSSFTKEMKQNYSFKQREHPLRWFSLADDVDC